MTAAAVASGAGTHARARRAGRDLPDTLERS